jgi:hypothetical protein
LQYMIYLSSRSLTRETTATRPYVIVGRKFPFSVGHVAFNFYDGKNRRRIKK